MEYSKLSVSGMLEEIAKFKDDLCDIADLSNIAEESLEFDLSERKA